MGKWVNNGMVSIPSSHSFGDEDILEEIGTLVGVGKRSDGRYHHVDMCQAASVNKWAKYKPIEHTTKVNLTEAQRIASNQGFVVDDSSSYNADSIVQNSATNAFLSAKANGASWVSIPVTGINRIRDFDGYNHAAISPFNGSHYATAVDGGNVSYLYFTVLFQYFSDHIKLTDLAIFNNMITAGHAWYWGIVFKGASGYTFSYLYKELACSTKYAVDSPTAKADGGGKTAYFRIPYSSTLESGTYEGYLMAVCESYASGDILHYLTLPTLGATNVSVVNPPADIKLAWVDSTSALSISGVKNTSITALSVQFLCVLPKNWPSGISTTIQLQLVGPSGVTSNYVTATPSTGGVTDVGTVAVFNTAVLTTSNTPIAITSLNTAYLRVRVQVGSYNTMYCDTNKAIGSYWGKNTYDTKIALSSIISTLGSGHVTSSGTILQ